MVQKILFTLLLLPALSFGADLEELGKKLGEDKSFLDELSSIANRAEIETSIHQAPFDYYQEVTSDWRKILKLKLEGSGLNYHLIDFSRIKDRPVLESVNYIKLKEAELLSSVENLFHKIAKKRSVAIKRLYQTGQTHLIKNNTTFYHDLILEVRSIPLRWISLGKSRYKVIRSDLEKGVSGWWKLFKELVAGLFVFILGIILYRLFKNVSKYLSKIRDEYARKSYRDKGAKLWASFLGKVAPILPWLWLVIFFQLAQGIIQNTYFKEVIFLFPYFTYYAYYRIFRVVVRKTLSSYSFQQYDRSFKIDREKIRWTAKFLARIFFLVLVLLHTLKSAGGEGFLYLWIEKLFAFILVFSVFFVCYRWCDEIRLVARKKLPSKAGEWVAKILSGPLKFFMCFPIFLLEIFIKILEMIYSFLERFDFVRTLSAQYFRKKIEVSSGAAQIKEHHLSVDYKEKFHSVEVESLPLQESQQEVFDNIMDHVKAWKNGDSDEHIALVSGEKGIGKSFLLNRIIKENNYCKSHYYRLNSRSSQKEYLNEIVSELKGKKESVLIIIDGLQYLFLCKRKGFEHFHHFLKLTQEEDLKHVFWCLGINNYSWEFIESVLNKTRYFNFIYKLEKWREEDVQKLIMHKHKVTDYKLSFEAALYGGASQQEDLDIEGRYFRILWEETVGNISLAQKIWLDSLKSYGENRVQAMIPIERKETLVQLPNEFYFVLATVVRHESLTIQEVMEATDLSEDLVRNSIKSCIERGYLKKKDESNISTALSSQHAIYSTLKRLNFIYG